MEAMRRKHHSRVGRFFLELVGWPVAPAAAGPTTPPGPSHHQPVHHEGSEHFLDPICGTCGTRHRADQPPRTD